MRYALAFLLILATPGCYLFHAHTEEYTAGTLEACAVSKALEENVGRIVEANLTLIAEDTQTLVDKGEMTPEARTEVLSRVKEQASVTLKQAAHMKAFSAVVHKEAEGDSVTSEDIKKVASQLIDIAKEIDKKLDELSKTD